MERPAKRMKITDPDVRNPRGSGSRMTEGLFTSEMGMISDETDRENLPTRTLSLADFQRQQVFGSYQHSARPVLPRRNAGIYLLPRAPDATVTASVVQVNVNDGTSTSVVTEVPVASTAAVVSLSDLGSLTTAVSVTIPGISNSTGIIGSTTYSSQDTVTSALTTPPPSGGQSTINTLSTSSSPDSSIRSGNSNGTTSFTSTDGRTVTVTATSTVELSLINGTIIVTEPPLGPSSTRQTGVRTTDSSSGLSKTFTFGELPPTASDSSGSSVSSGSGSSGTSSGLLTAVTGIGATGTVTGPSGSASSPSSGSSSGGGDGDGGSNTGLTQTQQQVVGGVVGGVAGIALVLVIVLFVLRWYRGHLKARGQLPEQIATRELAGGAGSGTYPMSQRSSTTPLAAAVAHGLKRLRPHSNQTLRTTATGNTENSVPESERGFQRIAGRKIAPVLGSGGDPYGGNFGAFEKDAGGGPSDIPNTTERGLSGASFYQDNRGFYGGKGTETPPRIPSSPTTAAAGTRTGDRSGTPGTVSSARDFAGPRPPSVRNNSQLSLATSGRPEGYAVMRPSPARTPVTLSPAASSIRLPIQQPPTLDENAPPMPGPPSMRDGVGRSLASLDGSRISRSSGRSGGRFVENM